MKTKFKLKHHVIKNNYNKKHKIKIKKLLISK